MHWRAQRPFTAFWVCASDPILAPHRAHLSDRASSYCLVSVCQSVFLPSFLPAFLPSFFLLLVFLIPTCLLYPSPRSNPPLPTCHVETSSPCQVFQFRGGMAGLLQPLIFSPGLQSSTVISCCACVNSHPSTAVKVASPRQPGETTRCDSITPSLYSCNQALSCSNVVVIDNFVTGNAADLIGQSNGESCGQTTYSRIP